MDSEALDSFRRSGGIIAKLRREVPEMVKPGRHVLEICEELEQKIRRLGGEPAFPVNVGINEIAAHYTSPPGDTLTIPRASLVKVDFGVHVKGYLADTAVTVFFDHRFEPMARAADEALKNAIKVFRPGLKMSEVGRVVQTTVEKYGFKPIRNLTGHNIDRYTIHAGKSVPNVPQLNGAKASEGEVYAIEPFVTMSNASGSVASMPSAYIYRYVKTKGAKSVKSGKIIEDIHSRFSSLPFTPRWLEGRFTREAIGVGIQELLENKCISSYPVLVEETRQPVAQSEHTVLVTADGCSVLTGS